MTEQGQAAWSAKCEASARGAVDRNMEQLLDALDLRDVGERMHRFISELYPVCRSITGEGFRHTLRRIREHIPLAIHEVPTGTRSLTGPCHESGTSAMPG